MTSPKNQTATNTSTTTSPHPPPTNAATESPHPSPRTTPAGQPVSPVDGAAAALGGAAGPLHAHIENFNQVVCDPSTATAIKTSGGFRVHLNYPGPAVVTASVMSYDDQTDQQHYTLGGQELGRDFTFTTFPFSQAEVITVSEISSAGAGTCDVVNHMQD